MAALAPLVATAAAVAGAVGVTPNCLDQSLNGYCVHFPSVSMNSCGCSR